MKKYLILTFCLALTASSCSFYRINSEEITENIYYPKKAEDVVVLDQVTVPHEIIGYVTVNTERNQSMDKILLKMKKEAAKLGGDAITNIQSNASGLWKKIPAQDFIGNAYIRANYTASVVAFQQVP